jgi:hypothetical protein
MLPKHHIFLGFIFSIFLYLIFPNISLIGTIIIFFSSFLIDVDHYLYYVFKKRDLSLQKAYKWYISKKRKLLSLSRQKRSKIRGTFLFLHGIEPLLILFLLEIFLSKYFFYILIGFAFHLLLDIIYQIKFQDRIDRISIIYDTLKFRELKILR